MNALSWQRKSGIGGKLCRVFSVYGIASCQSIDVLVCVCLFVQQINTDYHRCVVFHSMRNCHCMINGTKTVNFLCFCRLVGCIFIIQRPHLKLTLSLRVSPSQFKFQMHEIQALRLWNQFNGLLLFIVWRSLNFIFMFMYLRLRWEKCLIANSCSKEPNAQNKTHYIEKIWITGAQSKARGQNGTSATQSVLNSKYPTMNAIKTVWIIKPIQLSTRQQHAMQMAGSTTRASIITHKMFRIDMQKFNYRFMF